MSEPKGYDMAKHEDLERWFREMEGYFKNTGKHGFELMGTDHTGRVFAVDGFKQLKKIMLSDKNQCHGTKKQEG